MGEVLSGADLEAQQRNDLSGLGELILRLLLVSQGLTQGDIANGHHPSSDFAMNVGTARRGEGLF